jgi:hypothetical protein
VIEISAGSELPEPALFFYSLLAGKQQKPHAHYSKFSAKVTS